MPGIVDAKYCGSNKNEKADRKSCVQIICCMSKLC